MRLIKAILIFKFSVVYFVSFTQHKNVTLLGKWDLDSITNGSALYNDCWGWEYNGREYAVIGSSFGSHIIDITDPINPAQVDFVKGGSSTANVTHRDYKTHKNHLYMVCDQGFGNSTLQIADLTYLPDSVHVIYDSNNVLTLAHNIYIDTLNDRLYQCGGATLRNQVDLNIIDISDPYHPTLIVDCSQDIPWWKNTIGYVHDIHVKDNIAYTHGNKSLNIVDFTNALAPIILGNLPTYIDQGSNHSGWLHENGQTYVMLDETNRKKLKFLDVSNPTDVIVTALAKGGRMINNIAHNSFFKGNYAYTSYYEEGIYVFDVSDPYNVTTVGFYDTYPEIKSNSSYAGCWGIFPFYSSGNFVASDRQTGLYIFKVDENPIPIIDTIMIESLVTCPGDSTQFFHNSMRANNIKWIFEGGNPGESVEQEPIVLYNDYGDYDVKLIVWNDAGIDSLELKDIIRIASSTCLDFSEVEEIAMFPNPIRAGQILYFSDQTSVNLTTLTGEKLYSLATTDRLETRGLLPGVYLVKTDNKTLKLIVE